jgi:2-dehydro-3-deoxyphosphogluconate aldolase / (4S)-4-hydroxy-2-oxoglutarate aldolase
MKNKEITSCIEEIGIIPSIRVSSAADAHFVAESVFQGGIPIVEINMTIPDAIHVISDLVKHSPKMIVGAGGVLDKKTAQQCFGAGVQFLTTHALDLEIIEFAVKEGVTVLPGALTPTEVLTAWKAGADFVKIVPCAQVGGAGYIKALKAPFPQIPLIAAGGVNQQTASGFILAGAAALGIGGELIPSESIALRQSGRIGELCRRFSKFVATARREAAETILEVPVHDELTRVERPLVMQGGYL